ncbi:MAG TPA: alpha/beta fold hydrolase [Halococcus sp.]|nr:alpha/beta fold hydrolase [Halococcus sp.]
MAHEDFRRDSIEFESEGTRCAGWLYRPDESETESENPPVVVMAHGFGATMRMGLPAYAEQFAERGLAVLLFDYRTFGESDGQPRNVVDPFRHVEDCRAAISHARSQDGIDGDRIGVWGFSFGGGHALAAAARENVAAYVGQSPVDDGLRTLVDLVRLKGLDYALSTTTAGLKDLVRKYMDSDPHYLPIVGEPDELAALNTPGAKRGFTSMVPDEMAEEEWNRCAARVFLQIGRYRPITEARNVNCPSLIIQGTEDRLASESAIDSTITRLDDVTRVRYETTHFGGFADEFDRIAEREGDFLERHLFDTA